MTPTKKVSIARRAFSLEEEAFNKMESYLDTLEKQFSEESSCKEILEEIELRIAELLGERCGEGTVRTSDVEYVIRTLGSADEINEEKPSSGQDGSDRKSSKKLFRDPFDKWIGGVCSGLAAYIGREPIIIRIIFFMCSLPLIIGTDGEGIWITIALYLLLWLIIPQAKTTEERYKMRGESISIDSIKTNVENGAAEIERSAKEFNQKHPNFFKLFFRACSIIIGGAFILAGVGTLLALLIGTICMPTLVPKALVDFASSVISPGNAVLFNVALLCVISIPFILLLYLGSLMCFNFKSPKWHPGIWLSTLWIVAVAIVSAVSISSSLNYRNFERTHEEYHGEIHDNKIRLSLIGSDMDYDYIYCEGDRDSYELALIKGDNIYVYPKVEIRHAFKAERTNDVYQMNPGHFKMRSESVFFKHFNREPDFASYENGVISVEPLIYSKHEEFNEADCRLILYIPQDADIEILSPRTHDFKTYFRFSNIGLIENTRHRY